MGIKRRNNMINRIQFPTIMMQWNGKLGAAYSFKGIMDYEDWIVQQDSHIVPKQQNPFRGEMDNLEKWLRGEDVEDGDEWMTPQDMWKSDPPPRNEKERLWSQAKELRRQIDDAIGREDYDAAAILQKTMNVIEKKYNEL